LEGIDAFLPELWLGAGDSVVKVEVNDLIQMLIGLYKGEDAVMAGFTNLRLGISDINDHLPDEFGSDVVLDIFGVEIDDFEDEHGCEEVDFFLNRVRGTFCSNMRSCSASTILLA
jgi:hypothetical protein